MRKYGTFDLEEWLQVKRVSLCEKSGCLNVGCGGSVYANKKVCLGVGFLGPEIVEFRPQPLVCFRVSHTKKLANRNRHIFYIWKIMAKKEGMVRHFF